MATVRPNSDSKDRIGRLSKFRKANFSIETPIRSHGGKVPAILVMSQTNDHSQEFGTPIQLKRLTTNDANLRE
jgi:hypothetical protein